VREWLTLAKHEYMEFVIFSAMERYRPEGRIHATTTMIWPSEAESHLDQLRDYWTQFTNDRLSILTVKGEHDTWLDESVAELGDLLAERIASASGASPELNVSGKQAVAD